MSAKREPKGGTTYIKEVVMTRKTSAIFAYELYGKKNQRIE